MGIAGLGHQPENNLGRMAVKVFKGTRKKQNRYGTEVFGNDLNDKFRLQPCNDYAARELSYHFKEKDANGDFTAESLNIYLPFNEIDRTFDCAMRAYNGSNAMIRECDRYSIKKEVVTTSVKKIVGEDNFTTLKEIKVDKPCPVRDMPLSMPCSLSCMKEGRLSFYIAELFNNNLTDPSRIVVHGFEDISNITKSLNNIKLFLAQYGVEDMTTTPFPVVAWRHKIPYILTRVKVPINRPVVKAENIPGGSKKEYNRTGGRSASFTWAVDIRLNPDFLTLLNAWQTAQQAQKMGLRIAPEATKKLLLGDPSGIIDADYRIIEDFVIAPGIENNLLPPSIGMDSNVTIQSFANEVVQKRNTPIVLEAIPSVNVPIPVENIAIAQPKQTEVVNDAENRQDKLTKLSEIVKMFTISGDIVEVDGKTQNKARARLLSFLTSCNIDCKTTFPSEAEILQSGMYMLDFWLKDQGYSLKPEDMNRNVQQIMLDNKLTFDDSLQILMRYKDMIIDI